MNNSAIKTRLIRIAQRHLGDWGEQFIVHQCERLGMDIDNLTRADLEKLASEASNTAVLIVGKTRADGLRRDITNLSRSAD